MGCTLATGTGLAWLSLDASCAHPATPAARRVCVRLRAWAFTKLASPGSLPLALEKSPGTYVLPVVLCPLITFLDTGTRTSTILCPSCSQNLSSARRATWFCQRWGSLFSSLTDIPILSGWCWLCFSVTLPSHVLSIAVRVSRQLGHPSPCCHLTDSSNDPPFLFVSNSLHLTP